MSIGLVALLDDIAGLAKVAAASLDDVAGQAAKAGTKAVGVVIDDAAVTPRYVVGFDADRELPIIGRIALGSLRNKLVVLLPLALLLALLAPWAMTPLLMIGGAYLCYEGTEKVFEAVFPHEGHAHAERIGSVALDPKTVEDEKIASAVKTDFILSAEIMAITLAALPEGSFLTRAITLAVVGVGITGLVYGAVALIVKADDVGVALARNGAPAPFGRLARMFGRALVRGMPVLLSILGVVGTAAMIWVGGGILVHGLEGYGIDQPAHLIHDLGERAAHALPAAAGLLAWLVTAALSGLVGLVVGAALIPVAGKVLGPIWKAVKPRIRRAA